MSSVQAGSGRSLDAYFQYIAAERRARHPDLFVITTLYERAITEAAQRRYDGELGAEAALRSFWVGYLDALVRAMACFPDSALSNSPPVCIESG